jgi:hypothetical protein
VGPLGGHSYYYKVRRLPVSDRIESKWKTDRDGDNNVIIVPGFSEEGMVSERYCMDAG